MTDIKKLLENRAKVHDKHGSFYEKASFIQEMKEAARMTEGWNAADMDQRESIDMIIHKLGRILCGDNNHIDSWVDIAGYATLISDRLEKLN